MKRKQISMLLVFVLVIQCILPSGSYVHAAADTIKPELIRAFVDKTDVTVGDTVTVTVEAKDEGGSGLKRVYLYYEMPETRNIKLIETIDQGNGIYKGTYTVEDNSENGEWNLDNIYISDNADNTNTIYNRDNNPEFKKCSFNVSGTTCADTIKPELISASVDKKDVTVGDKVTITVEAKDEGGSGIKCVYLNYCMPETGKINYNVMNDEGNGIYKLTYTIDNNSENGEWNVNLISIADNADNYKTISGHENNPLLSSCSFNVSGTTGADTIKPELVSVAIDKPEVTVGDKVNVTVEAKDEGGSGLNRVFVTYNMPETGKDNYIIMNDEGNGIYKGAYTVTDESEIGEWSINFISIYDNAENNYEINQENGADQLKSVAFKVFRDTTPPVYEKDTLSVNKNKISENESTTVSFKASDDRGIDSATITYYQPSTQDEVILPCTYNEKLGVYEATYTAKKYSASGIWQIKNISIIDMYNNTAQIFNSNIPNSENVNEDLKAGDFEVYGTTLDNEPPSIDLSSINVHSNKIELGKEFTFSFQATDKVSGIKKVVATYRKPNNEVQEVEVAYNTNTQRYECSITSNEESELGDWSLESLVIEDNAENIEKYTEMNGKLDFSFYRKIDELSPINGVSVFLEDTDLENTEIWGDIYIGPKAVVTLDNVTVYGDIYVLGVLNSYSTKSSGSLIARDVDYGVVTSLNNGKVVLYGDNTFASYYFADHPITEIPLQLVDNKIITVDGYLQMKGATVDVAEMYVNDELVDTSQSGRFIIDDRYVGDISSVKVEWRTVFDDTITKYYDVENFVTTNGVLNHKPTISASDIYLSVGETYNLLENVSASDIDDGDLTKEILVSENTVDINKVGIYTVKYQVTDHLGETVYTTVNVYVEKGMPKVTFPTAAEITYGQRLFEADLTGIMGNGRFIWDDPYVIPSAGSSNYSMTFIPDDQENYNSVSKEIPVTVKKAIPAYTVPDNLSVTYGAMLSDITLPAGFAWKDDLMTPTGNIGENVFKAIYTPEDTMNYECVADIDIPVKVVPVVMDDVEIEDVEAQVYTSSRIEPALAIKYGKAELKAGEDYTLSFKDNTEVGTAIITVTGTGNYTGTRDITFSIRPKTLEKNVSVSKVESAIFTGKEINPTIEIKDGEKVLCLGQDYTVVYIDNINVGTAVAQIEGVGNYAGKLQVNFEIESKTITEAEISEIKNETFTGKEITPSIKVKDGEKDLLLGQDYTVSFKDNIEVGTATAQIEGMGNYAGKVQVNFEIKPKTLTEAEIPEIENEVFTGKEITPSIKVKDEEKVLLLGQDYTVSYKDNINVGTATVQIEGIGNYAGKVQVNFEIKPKTITEVEISEIKNETFTGKQLTPSIKVKDGEKVLLLGQDYTVVYKDNINVGTATAQIEGIGNYAGKVQVNFEIQPKALTEAEISEIKNEVFAGKALEPQPTVLLDRVSLKRDVDYTLEYTNNTSVGTAKVKVIGKGNYQGTKELTFTIEQRDLSDVKIQTITNHLYTGSKVTPELILEFSGVRLEQGIDYEAEYSNNVQVGHAKVTIQGKGNFTGSIESGFDIVQKSMSSVSVDKIANQVYTGAQLRPAAIVKDAGKVLANGKDYTITYKNNVNCGTATVVISGKGIYAGSISRTFQITKRNISVVKTSGIKTQTYTGKALKPGIKVTDGNRTLRNGVDYKLSYTNNKNCGTATIQITGAGNYSGNKKINFTIKPAKGAIKKVTSSKAKTATISWNKVSGVSGYEIAYATSKNGKYKTVNAKTKTSYTVKSLQAKKTYYFKMRAYKTVNGKKVYGDFSNVKSVKIKK